MDQLRSAVLVHATHSYYSYCVLLHVLVPVQVVLVQLYGTEHQLDDDLSIYRICTYKYDSYWYEYKYRTAVSTVFSMCTVTVRARDQVRIDAFLRRYLAFRSILQ